VPPTNGSKEALYLIHQAVIDPQGERRRILIPEPAYPVYRIAARFAGGVPTPVPLRREEGFLPRWKEIPARIWNETAALWINTPHNPTGSTADREWLRDTLDTARARGVWVFSDEPYSEIYFGDPPAGMIEISTDGVVVFNTLSKRSAMAGYRSGFIAGDSGLIENLKRLRPSQGIATPLFIQKMAVEAWTDEDHVEEQRARYRAKRDLLLAALERAGLDVFPSEATFYLWVAAPAGLTSEDFCRCLLESRLVTAPGTGFGPSGEGYIRMALVPTLEECREAASILASRPWEGWGGEA
jgi:aspartate/methionine/tyrosine aminotransferase